MEFIQGFDENGDVVLVSADLLIEESEEKEKIKYNEWIKMDRVYIPARNTKICKLLDPGYYSVVYSDGSYKAVEEDIDTDELFYLPNNIINQVVDEMQNFWTKSELFESNKIVHKRGILLCGTPGCGKTGLINLIAKDVISRRNGLIFRIKSINDLNIYIDFIHLYLREIEPNTPVITIIEDIDSLAARDESTLSNFLDGDDQFEHHIVLATTNRLHELNDLMLRPSRFDWIITVEPPIAEVREFYLDKKGIDKDELKLWVDKTDTMSMAQLKELFIAVKLLDNDFDSTIDKLKDQQAHATRSTFQPPAKSVGFEIGKKR